MKMDYITNINNADKNKVLLLIDCSIQAYNAFNSSQPEICFKDNVKAPDGYELIDHWSGVDTVFHRAKTTELYGLVFRTIAAPYRYIFAFRGTNSVEDILDDMGILKKRFVAFDENVNVPESVQVESGFFDVYTETNNNLSMQQQLFALIDQYEKSDKPIDELYITGHSLGSALSELFTLDIALSRPKIKASNYNYACPRVGNQEFVDLYTEQPAQKNPTQRTLRIQNTYDKVPCVPLVKMGFQHVPYAYLIAFFRSGFVEKYNIIERHSSLNYQAVLECAARSSDGICQTKNLDVKSTDHTLTSEVPDEKKVCSA